MKNHLENEQFSSQRVENAGLVPLSGPNKGQNKGLLITIEGRELEVFDQYLTGLQLKRLRGLSESAELYLTISQPWKDELINNDDQVDLARPGIEQFYVKQKLKYIIDGKQFESSKQFIKGSEIRSQGHIPVECQIFLSIKGPWEDELIKDDELIDLARPGVEHFYSKKEDVQVVIIVNGRERAWIEKTITFQQVVALAFGNYSEQPRTVYTVTYAKGPKENPEGTMVKGDKVIIKAKMVFNVTATNKS